MNLLLKSWRINDDGSITFLREARNNFGLRFISAVSLPMDPNTLEKRVVVAGKIDSLELFSWRVEPVTGNITFLARSGDQAGYVGDTSIVQTEQNIVVTAVKDGSNNLVLISWEVEPGTGKLIRLKDTHSEDEVEGSQIRAVTMPQNNIVVTAFSDEDSELRCISWIVDTNGKFSRMSHTDEPGAVGALDIVPIGGDKFVTPVQDGSFHLTLILFQVDSLTRLADTHNLQTSNFSLMVRGLALPDSRVVTAIPSTTAGNQLLLELWRVEVNNIINQLNAKLLHNAIFGRGKMLLISPEPTSQLPRFLVGVNTGPSLDIITFRVSSDSEFTLLNSANVGSVSPILNYFDIVKVNDNTFVTVHDNP